MRIMRSTRRGFSLVELIVVLVIMMAVTAIAIPNFITYISTYRLRGAATEAAGLLQEMRIEAVKRNTVLQVSNGTMNGRTAAWVNLPGGTSSWDAGEPFLLLPKDITVTNYEHPGDATTGLQYTAQSPSTAVIKFNSRGLPCITPSGGTVCDNYDATNGVQVGFVVYFKNNASLGSPQWGAVTITPTGRVSTWFWTGRSYSSQ